MVLYLKAGPDGTSVGDCPFAHFVRLVLEEKGLPYTVKPTVQETKPQWLVDHYDGKLPALRHRKECYVESNVIAEYLDFFFQDPKPLKPPKTKKAVVVAAETAVDGFFPAVAKYLKNTDSEKDPELLENLKRVLSRLEQYLKDSGFEYLCGSDVSLLDCSLIPKLYHLTVGVEGYKGGAPSISSDYPSVAAYYQRAIERPSFKATEYPKETVLWGWGNARS
jgi:glutathione S-transferase